MIITTTNCIEGYKIEKYLGLVSANQVVGANLIADFIASFSDVFGGNSGAYRDRLDNLYSQIVLLIQEKASKLGANAVVGLHIDFDEISGKGKSMFMVTAVGTAVIYVNDRYEVFRKLRGLKLYLKEGFITPEEYERESTIIRKQHTNEIEKESKRLKEEAERQRNLAEIAERQRMERIEKLRAAEEKVKMNGGLSDRKTLYGFKVDDAIEIKETGDCTSIDAFTEDNRVVCKLDGETKILEFNEIKLV